MTTFIVSLRYQGVGGLFLFLVCCALYLSRRRPYFLYWTLAWCSFSCWLLLASVPFEWDEQFRGLPGLRPWIGQLAHLFGWWHPLLWLFGMLSFRTGRPLGPGQGLALLTVAAGAVVIGWLFPPAVQDALLAGTTAAVYGWSSAILARMFRRHGRPGLLLLAAFLALYSLQQLHYVVLYTIMVRVGMFPAYFNHLAFADFLLETLIAVGMIVVLLDEDVTDREWVEETLHKQTAILKSILDNMSEGVVLVDQDGELVLFNPAAERMMGFGARSTAPEEWPELYGIYLQDTVTPCPIADLPLMRSLGGESVDNCELWLRRAKREGGVWINVSSRPLRDETGALQGAVVVFHDITERKRTEAELQRAKEAAEAATRSRSEFLANVSHEIRTPMNAIVGMTEMVLATRVTREQKEHLDVVKAAADSLLAVINDILDFSKIEARKLELHPVEFRLRSSLATTTKMLGLRAGQQGLELLCRIGDDVPDLLVGDPDRLRQVVINLLGNAIKFTERGTVSVTVDIPSRTEEGVCLHFAVADTGIGIPAEKLQTIFQPFEQSDSSTTRRYGGTGLGLAISVNLVELMGGKIWVESEEGRGSTFHFTVRFQLPPKVCGQAGSRCNGQAAEEDRPEPARQALRILLAEDNAFNHKPVLLLLDKQGHKVELVRNGKEALAALERQRFDLVLMDVQMPEMDGYEATAAIRAGERTAGEHLPIIAITAHALDEARQQCLEAGMDGYVAKPVQAHELWRAIAQVVPSFVPPSLELPPAALEASAVLDRAAVLSRVDNNVKLLHEIIGLFQHDCPRLIADIRDAVAVQDGPRLKRVAHTIKGSVGFFSATGAAQAARRLERVGSECLWPQADEAFTVLEDEIGRLQAALAGLGEETRT